MKVFSVLQAWIRKLSLFGAHNSHIDPATKHLNNPQPAKSGRSNWSARSKY